MSDLWAQCYFSRIIARFQNCQWLMVDDTEVKSLNRDWWFLPWEGGRRGRLFFHSRELKTGK